MDQLIIACCRKKHIFCLTDVIRLEARSSYTVIYSLSKPPLTVAKVLSDYETLLVNMGFLRVHRSFLVNKDRIDAIEENDLVIAGTRLPVGKTYRDALMKKLSIL